MADPDTTVYESNEAKAFLAAIGVQAAVANPAVPAFVSANAGSGKTKVLIDRVARLLLRRDDGRKGAEPDSILCITYTKAAASEMLTRLFKTLGRWSVMEDPKLRSELAGLEGRDEAAYTPDDLKAARALFARALESPGGLRIETIHAFCSRILRRFPQEAGVLPGFSEIEEDEASALWQAARAGAVMRAQEATPDLLGLLALEGGHDGAMAGLDMLRWSASVVLDFAEVHAFDFDAMDFALRDGLNAPQACAREMLALAMGERLPVADLKAAVAVLQGGAVSDQKTAEALIAVLEAPNSEDRWDIYRGIFTTGSGDYRKSNPYTAASVKQSPLIADLFQMKDGEGREVARVRQLAEDLTRACAFERTSALLRVGVPALQAYQREKAARAALDFDDLIHKTRILLTQDGMSDWVLYKLDGGLSHVLLDEAQDTSPPQWELITALTEEFFSGLGAERQQDPRTLFVVGDEKQSIYSFQGADPSKFRDKQAEFGQRAADMVHGSMDMSFRSAPQVLAFVDRVWNGAPPIDVPHAPLTADVVNHVARRASQPGCVELWPIEPVAEDEPADAWDRPVNAMRSSSPKAKLAKRLAARIREMIDSGEAIWAEQPDRSWVRRPMQPQDVLVLVRGRTGGLFDAMIGALKSAGLPVAGADRLKLLDHIGVQDCLNLLRFVVLPDADLTLAEILRGPFLGLVDDDRYLYPLAGEREKGVSLWTRVQESTDPEVQAAAGFLRSLLERTDLAPYEFLSSVLDHAGQCGQTGWEKINARLGTPARDPVEALMSRALQQDSAEPASLQGFLAAMEAHDTEIKRDLAAPEREVRVMTVHGAKGLQAPVVVLPDTTAGPRGGSARMFGLAGMPVWSPRKDTDTPELSAQRAIADAKAEEEHRRLLYVALTRAQDRLIIAGHWHGGGKEGFNKKSWYALCADAMDAFVPGGGGADEVRRHGVPGPVMGGKGAGSGQEGKVPDWALRPPPADTPARRLSAPTSLLSRQTPVLAPFGVHREAQMKRGRLIHSLLQYLPELPEAIREAAGRTFLERDAELDDARRVEMLAAAMGVLSDPAMADVFAPGGRAEAAVIGTSEDLPRGVVINGRVDRLVVTPERVLVIDFKTDQPAPETVSGVADTYMAQMAAYWAVLRQAYRGRDVVAALCWTDGPKLMVLPEANLLASLKRAQSEV